jgi:hypothetical protein
MLARQRRRHRIARNRGLARSRPQPLESSQLPMISTLDSGMTD